MILSPDSVGIRNHVHHQLLWRILPISKCFQINLHRNRNNNDKKYTQLKIVRSPNYQQPESWCWILLLLLGIKTTEFTISIYITFLVSRIIILDLKIAQLILHLSFRTIQQVEISLMPECYQLDTIHTQLVHIRHY
jgi:hypothetical protein